MVAQEVEVAWAAGLIEGEGSIQLIRGKISAHDGRQLMHPMVRVVMTDLDVVEHIRQVFGCGSVSPYRNTQGLGKKQLYRWDVRRFEQVQAICRAIYPFMGQRRRGQIDHVMDWLETNPPTTNSERTRRRWVTIKARSAA